MTDFIDRHGLWPVLFVLALVLWGAILDGIPVAHVALFWMGF